MARSLGRNQSTDFATRINSDEVQNTFASVMLAVLLLRAFRWVSPLEARSGGITRVIAVLVFNDARQQGIISMTVL